MRKATHSLLVTDVDKAAVGSAWSDVNDWRVWDTDLECAKLRGPFHLGAAFVLRPKGGPNVKIRLERVDVLVGYTDLTRFPLARMYGVHDMEETPDGLRLTTTIRVEGILGWLWRKLVAQKVADESPTQLLSLVAFARQRTAALTHA